MNEVLSNILVHLFYYVGVVFLVGFLISLINRWFYALVGETRIVCYATGFLGTPIHELSHALMCLVFFHRITDIKFFQIDESSGVLGYVNHSYNRRNLYQVLGNYFIGTAPILLGTVFLGLLMYWLLPDAFAETAECIADAAHLQGDGISADWFGYAWAVFSGILGILFSHIGDGWAWWLFLLIALCVAIHMNLSGADIKGSLGALPILVILIVVANLLLSVISDDLYAGFVDALNFGGSYLVSILLLSLLLSLLSLAVALIVRLIQVGS